MTATNINFLDRHGSAASKTRSVNLRSDLLKLELLEGKFFALVFAHTGGCLVQLFEAPVASEAAMLLSAMRTACAL